MASDLISRKALLKEFAKRTWHDGRTFNEEGYFVRAYDVHNMIDKAPAVDAVEVVRCEDCAHSKREGNALRCPYSTVDLDQKGYCSRGIPIAMAAKAPLDEHVKKAITEGEWDDHA